MSRPRLLLRSGFARIAQHLPGAVFLLSVVILTLFYGYLSADRGWFPYKAYRDTEKIVQTAAAQIRRHAGPPTRFIETTVIPPDGLDQIRIQQFIRDDNETLGKRILVAGGLGQFLDHCPGYGCIAVEYERSGEVVQAYPYRPDDLSNNIKATLEHETVLFDPIRDIRPVGVVRLPSADLIVTFHMANAFPYAGGIARIGRDGHVVWFRGDYSHHWPVLLADGEIAVPSGRRRTANISADHGHFRLRVECPGTRLSDTIQTLDLDGNVTRTIDVEAAILRSPYRMLMYLYRQTEGVPCDQTHLNFVREVSPEIADLLPGVDKGDFLISLRNLNAFAILRRRDETITHVFQGSFLRQHSVTPIPNSTAVLIFDNLGADENAGPSRVIEYDLASGRERVLLPRPEMDPGEIFSQTEGQISVLSDGTRALVSATRAGLGYEIRLSDGAVLMRFNGVHPYDSGDFPMGRPSAKVARFDLTGLYYVDEIGSAPGQ